MRISRLFSQNYLLDFACQFLNSNFKNFVDLLSFLNWIKSFDFFQEFFARISGLSTFRTQAKLCCVVLFFTTGQTCGFESCC